MRVKPEFVAKGATRAFDLTFLEYVEKRGPKNFLLTRDVPRLGQARGKIVILQEFPSDKICGLLWGESISIADDYVVKSLLDKHTNAKWASVESHLVTARDGAPNKLHLTFCSGTSPAAYPNAVADRTNRKLWTFMRDNTGKRRWGVVILDFPATPLIHLIINSNQSG